MQARDTQARIGSSSALRLGAVVVACVATGCVALVDGRDRGNGDALTPAEYRAAAAELAAPQEPHAFLARLEGSWDVVMLVFPAPGVPPHELRGSMISEVILDGRFLHNEFEARGEDGMTLRGLGLTGYDNATECFTGTWIDTQHTSFSPFSCGERSANGQRLILRSTFKDPLTGEKLVKRDVLTLEGPDRHLYESFVSSSETSEFRAMSMVLTRTS